MLLYEICFVVYNRKYYSWRLLMKAVYINNPGEVEIRDIAKPERKKGEVLLKILYGGICGSDLGSYRGSFAYFDYPRIPGHEFSAEIVEIDENDRGLKKGMIVTCNPYFNDGTCYSCKNGSVNACEHNETLGCQRDGAFCEYKTMPIERVYDGKGLDPIELAAIEPFCISYHGVKRGKVKQGDNVLVIGAGTIGVLAAVSAKSKGAKVYIADIAPDKLEKAKGFGVDGIILNSSPEEFTKQVNEITNNNGFDVTIEAVGLPSTFQNCIDAACFGGRVVLIGVGKKNLDFYFTRIQQKELDIYGSRNALKSDFLELIDLVKGGEIPLKKIVTDMYEFDDVAKAFDDFSKNQGQMLKVMIDFTK
jgi:2-desacetyl-2-hydroxyethyl bacteriochlorophyllide A dehydrogenase